MNELSVGECLFRIVIWAGCFVLLERENVLFLGEDASNEYGDGGGD